MHSETSTLFGFSCHGPQLWHRWRTLGTLVSSAVIMLMATIHGFRAADGPVGADWSSLMIYVCGAVIVGLQVDRLMRH